MKIITHSLLLLCSLSTWAESTIDIYGERDRSFDKSILDHKKEILAVESNAANFLQAKTVNNGQFQKYIENKILLQEKIRRAYGFLNVDIETVHYSPGNQSTTIEVISRDTPQRFEYISPDYLNYLKEGRHDDIIAQANEYYALGSKLLIENTLIEDKQCQALSCTWGFQNKELQPYKKILTQGAQQNIKYLANILYTAKNPQRKTGAIVLLGFLSQPQEIIALLIPVLRDDNQGVRNLALTAIASTLDKAPQTKLNTQPFIKLLDSPFAIERSKSLDILLELSKSKKNANAIAKTGGKKLLTLLELKQPNNHLPAYQLLKKISGKTFAEYDLPAWEKWVSQHQ
jgi:hypothetical protein